VVTGYFPVTPSKAVGKGQAAFRRSFSRSSADAHGYTKADLYFPYCVFLIQNQTLPSVFAMVKVCVFVKLDSAQPSRVGALSLTVTLCGDTKELSQTYQRPDTQQLLSWQMPNISYFQRRFGTELSLICGELVNPVLSKYWR